MAKRLASTPKKDGYRMPGEFEPQKQIWMIWPERPDNWQHGGKDAQKAFTNVAKAISKFTRRSLSMDFRFYLNQRQLSTIIKHNCLFSRYLLYKRFLCHIIILLAY